MRYIYEIKSTVGATGFAGCRPDPAPDLSKALALLGERPLDIFLRRHLLEDLASLADASLASLATDALAQSHAALASLLLERQKLAPAPALLPFVDALAALARPLPQHTPLPLLLRQAPHPLRKLFCANIQTHAKIDSAQLENAPPPPLAEKMAANRGILRQMRAEMATPESDTLPPPERTYARAAALLAANGIVDQPEMRHEASLCPIALLRQWNLRAGAASGANAHVLEGKATAYGRGLSLAQARCACAMEIVERACAHASIDEHGNIGTKQLIRASFAELDANGRAALRPRLLGAIAEADEIPLHWLSARDATGQEILVPAQAAYMFCNLPEMAVFEHLGSTGLASGATSEHARLAALTEVLERDAQATAPFDARACFDLDSRDDIIRGLLLDYRWRGIRVQFQDISNEFGFPAYRCFVQGKDGGIAQATGANLSGPRAALAALTETPWPYVWANPVPAPSGRGLPDLPRRMLEDLPNYSLPSAAASLRLLERALMACGITPVYVELTRPELEFPVFRAFAPGLETDPELENGPSNRLLARACKISTF